jgi:tight adherence protein C
MQQLARAGFRKSSALNLYNGSRGLASAILSLALTGVCLLQDTDTSTLIMAALGGVMAGFFLPGEFLRLMIRRRARTIQRALPNMLDMLTICVESGLGLDQAILHVSRELGRAHQELSQELSMINFETRAGKSRPEALRNLAARTGVQDVKELTAVLIQADRFGTSVAQTLRTYSNHLRIQARQRAEEKAAQLSVKLVFPIFFFILPSLFVITVGPVVVRIVRDLLPMMNSL